MISPPDYYRNSPKEGRFVREVSGPFEVSSGQRKRIAKCERLGMSVDKATIEECLPIIADNRTRKGRPYSMTLADWLEIEPWAHCFKVIPGPVAVGMCVEVSPETLYIQAWGDIPGQEQNSPVALLCKGIYEWCLESPFKTLDVGISHVDGVMDEGLKRFKESLGFHPL